jgi:hypothetical protein
MAHQAWQTETSALMKAASIVEGLAAERISHRFGVSSDYGFPICDAVERSPKSAVRQLSRKQR